LLGWRESRHLILSFTFLDNNLLFPSRIMLLLFYSSRSGLALLLLTFLRLNNLFFNFLVLLVLVPMIIFLWPHSPWSWLAFLWLISLLLHDLLLNLRHLFVYLLILLFMLPMTTLRMTIVLEGAILLVILGSSHSPMLLLIWLLSHLLWSRPFHSNTTFSFRWII